MFRQGWCWRYNWLLATYLSLLQPLFSTEKGLKKGRGVPEFIASTLAKTSNHTANQSPGREESLHAWVSFAELQHFWLLSSSLQVPLLLETMTNWSSLPVKSSPGNWKTHRAQASDLTLAKVGLSHTSSPPGVFRCKTKETVPLLLAAQHRHITAHLHAPFRNKTRSFSKHSLYLIG